LVSQAPAAAPGRPASPADQPPTPPQRPAAAPADAPPRRRPPPSRPAPASPRPTPPAWQPGPRTRGRPARRGIAHVGKGAGLHPSRRPRSRDRRRVQLRAGLNRRTDRGPRRRGQAAGALQDHRSQHLSKNHIQARFHTLPAPASHPAKPGKTQPEQAVLCTPASRAAHRPPAPDSAIGVPASAERPRPRSHSVADRPALGWL
jgi:hypothetical protein